MSDKPLSGMSEQATPFLVAENLSRAADETVGLIVVHGIGEQKKGDHLDTVVRPLANALARSGRIVTIAKGAPEMAEAAKEATPDLRILAQEAATETSPARLVAIAVHEVHWADINEPPSILKGIRFWLWGFSAWLMPEKDRSEARSFVATLADPRFPKPMTAWGRWTKVRLPLLGLGLLFAALAPLIVLADFLAQRVFKTSLPVKLATIVNFLSAVKLYSQPRRHGAGMLESAVEPPRYAVRRRMVRTLADVALAGYDRWYVLAHSQGTVVAHNGLMASSPALAAYLDKERLAALCHEGMAGPWRDPRHGPDPALLERNRLFRPSIPAERIGIDRTVYRDRLFAAFRGILTYGSPLDKFAAIWPPTVALCRDMHAFPKKARWINVWDPTDPVSASLEAFDPDTVFDASDEQHTPLPANGDSIPLRPQNVAYAAFPILLWSHIRYLGSKGKGGRSLVGWTADWLMGKPVRAEDIASLDDKAIRRRRWLATAQTVLLAGLLFYALLVARNLWSTGLSWSALWSITGPMALSTILWLLGITATAALLGWLTTEHDVSEHRTQTYRPRTLAAIWYRALKKRYRQRMAIESDTSERS